MCRSCQLCTDVICSVVAHGIGRRQGRSRDVASQRILHRHDIVRSEHAGELGVVDLAVAVVVGEVDEGLDGGVLDVGDVELDQQPLDLLALQVARAVVVDGLEGVRQPAVLRQKL